MGVEERLDAHLVASAEKRLSAYVPDGEAEIAQKMLDAVITPSLIGAKDEFDIGGVGELPVAAALREAWEAVINRL